MAARAVFAKAVDLHRKLLRPEGLIMAQFEAVSWVSSPRKAVVVQTLTVLRRLHQRIGLQHPAQPRIIDAPVHVDGECRTAVINQISSDALTFGCRVCCAVDLP